MRSIPLAVVALALSALVPVAHAGVQEFLRRLPDLEVITEADAVKAAAVLVGERAHAEELAACEARVRSRGMLDPGDAFHPESKCHKGFAAMLFARGMGLKGGWASRLAGKMGPRLAYKELSFMNILPPMGERDLMTGAELLACLQLSQAYLHDRELERASVKDYRKKRHARYGTP
jgi:hypothetical protein